MREIRCSCATSKFDTPTKATFPSSLNATHRAPRFFDGPRVVPFRTRRPRRPVNLIQIDALRLQPPQALLDFLANRWCAQAVEDISRVIPHETGLREHIGARLARHVCQRSPDHFLGMPEAIHGGRIDPVQTDVDSMPYRRDRIGIVLMPPAKPPVAADSPSAEADRSETECGLTELLGWKRHI